MTEDIGSDAHRRPSSAEIDVTEKLAIMRERMANAKQLNEKIVTQLDIVISKISHVETSLLLGQERFRNIEGKANDTSKDLESIRARLTIMEGTSASVTNKVLGGLGALGFLAGAATWIKEIWK